MLFTPRKILLAAVTILALFLLLTPQATPNFDSIFGGFRRRDPILEQRKQDIADAFQHAWDGYAKYCLGHDGIKPVSHDCDDDFGGWAVAAIDALSTAIILEKEDVVVQILEYIPKIDFHTVTGGEKIQMFEVSIRHFGGMISAWDLLHGPFSHMARNRTLRQGLYHQMIVLGDVLSCGFDTPSGVPRYWIDPKRCTTDDGHSQTVASAGTLILEFARLSEITGNLNYTRLAERAEGYLLDPKPASGEPFPGLLGSYVSVSDGMFSDKKGSWGALSDSFYEYLIKAYIYDSTTYAHYLDRWLLAVDSTLTHILSHPYGHPEWALVPYWEGTKIHKTMDSLSWFAGGNIILGGMVTDNQTLIDAGLSIADAAGGVYNMTVTGLGPEIIDWSTSCQGEDCDSGRSIRITDAKFRLRPEVVETWYYAYRATKNPQYREWSWTAFQAVLRYCKTDVGFSSLNNVDAVDGGGKVDVQESFVFAELLKYFYLIQLEDYKHPFHAQDSRSGVRNTWVFNTEAHPLKVVGKPV